MDQWDPMKDAFQNTRFNSYNEGVGRDLLGSNQLDKGARLYVQNVPVSLGRNGFYNMFSEYGQVVHHFLKDSGPSEVKTYGFITMENLQDAETAISKLNKKQMGQFTLRVSPALSEEERNRRKKLKQDEEKFSLVHRNPPVRTSLQDLTPQEYSRVKESLAHTQRTSGLDMERDDFLPRSQGIGRGIFHKMTEKGDGNHHPQGNQFHSMDTARGLNSSPVNSISNTTMPYGIMNMPDNYQGGGLGVFKHETVTTSPKSFQAERVKLCVFCYKEECVNVCARCKMYYCSYECQQKDWHNHKDICITIGEAFRSDTNPSSDSNGDNSQMNNPRHNFSSSTDVETMKYQMNKDTQIRNGDGRRYESDSNVNEIRYQDKKTVLYASSGQTDQFQNNNKFRNYKSNPKGSLSDHETPRYQDEAALSVKTANYAPEFNKFKNKRDEPEASRLATQQSIPHRSRQENTSVPKSLNKENEFMNNITTDSKRNIAAKFENKAHSDAVMRSPNCQNRVEEKSIESQQNIHIKTEEAEKVGVKAVALKASESSPPVVGVLLSVKSSGMCYLTYFESPYKFYISLQDHLEVFTDNTMLMEKEISKLLIGSPIVCTVGGTYAVFFMGEWCRVTVLSIKGREVNVFFVDYGNQATVKREVLRTLTESMLELQAQAICCCVSALKPRGSESWNEAATAAVKKWMGEPMNKFLQYETIQKCGLVHAVNISINNVSLSEVLVSGGFAEHVNYEPGLSILTKSEHMDHGPKRHMAHALTSIMDDKKNGDNITVVLVEFLSTQRIIVLDIASHNVLKDLASLLQSEYANSTVSYRPVQGELVAAKFSGDGNWYRAEVTSIDGDSFTLFFVDYGNSEVQTVKNIRSVTNPNLMKVPKQVLICGLFALKPLPDCGVEIIDKEFHKLLLASTNNLQQYSLQVKEKTKDALLVDFVARSGASLFDALAKKLLELGSGKQHQGPSRFGRDEQSASNVSSLTSPLLQADCVSHAVVKQVVPKLDLGTETLTNVGGKMVNVIASYVKNPAEFYVQLNSKHELFLNMMKQLNGSVMSSPMLSTPSVGSLVALQFSQDDIWYRGRIEKINDVRCIVFFIDYGNSEKTLLSNLRVLPSSVCSLPAQAIKCHLEGKLENLSTTSVLEFKQQLEDKSVDVKVCGTSREGVSVQVFLDGIDISPYSQQKMPPSPVKPTPTIQPPASVLNISTEVLPDTGEPCPVTVTHIDSFSRLFISRKDTDLQAKLYLVMLNLNKSVHLLPHLDNPFPGCVCAALYSKDHTWYRAHVIEMSSLTTCIVQFVDYGNTEETEISNLRELEPTMTKLPAQAICCCLFSHETDMNVTCSPRSLSSDTTELIHKLKTEVLEKTVSVRVVDRKLDTWIIKMENEHRECISRKFTISTKPPLLQIAKTPMLSDLIFETPSEKEYDAILLHMNNLSDFYCQRCNADEIAALQSLSDKLKEDMSTANEDCHIDPVINGIYASMFENSWYRCVVEEVKKPKVLIRYIDYGNSEEIPINQLRPVSPERLLPVRLFKCKLHGVTPVQENWNSPNMGEYLKILRSNILHLVVQAKEKDTFLVSLFFVQGSEKVSVAEDLVGIGMAEFSQVASLQKEEARPNLPYPVGQLHQPRHMDNESDEEDNELEIQRKIQELQMQLKVLKQKKHTTH